MTQQAAQLRHWLSRVVPGEAVLVVSHGGIAEVGVTRLLGDRQVTALGRGFDYCEGAMLELDGDEARSVRRLRFGGDCEVDPFSGQENP